MKRFMLESPEGLFLNTDYHSSISKGIWRSREEARLYRSTNGILSAFRRATPAVVAKIGFDCPNPRGIWSDEDRELFRRFGKSFAEIPAKERLALYLKDGYILHELEI